MNKTITTEEGNAKTAVTHDIKLSSASDEQILKAISLRFSDCFMAMIFARSFNGRPSSAEWDILENDSFDTTNLLQEATKRGLDYENLKVAVGEGFVKDAKRFIQWYNSQRQTS